MYLKQLELKGFKSFAVQTELEFVPGVTAVVGPNGSGKSNVSDAVRWVLGEQSARSLRGGKMEDVIFSGSDSRHAVNYCDVTLTLDNSGGDLPLAYNDVTITRRLYRSGDSEYYINRQPCRLRDITELFMDTGLGKEAYSVIGQGRIDEILSTKAEERRGIFEDAAGIVKFKVRKREAQRKLDETEQNLARLHDLIVELQEQAGPLQEQAEKAMTYRRIRDQLKQCDIGLYVHNITEIHKRWKHLSDQLKLDEQEKLAAKATVNQQEAAMEKEKWRLQELDEQLEAAQQNLLTTSAAVEKAEGQRDVLLERGSSQQSEKERFQEQAQHLQKRVAHIERDRQKIKERLQEKQAEVAKTRHDLQLREANLQRLTVGTEEALEKVKSDLIELMGEQASLKNDLRHLDEQEKANHEQWENLAEEQEQATAHAVKIKRELTDTSEEKKTIAHRLETQIDQFRALAQKLENIRQEEGALSKNMRELERKLNGVASRREVLNELEAEFSGFFHGVKEVLKARDNSTLSGIKGAVAELVNVPRELETALETALGGALQHIVVNDAEHARFAIEHLKKHRLGRATFLPMDVIQSRALPAREKERIGRDKGFVGIGADLVSYDPLYENIVASLLGNVVIARKIGDAGRLARLLRHRYRVVTLDGDIVHPGGSMSGGSAHKRRSNLLGRKRELDDLEKEMKAMAATKKDLTIAIQIHNQEIAALEDQLETMRSEGEALRLQEQKLSSELEHKRAEQTSVNDRLQLLHDERDDLSQKAKAFTNKRLEIKTALTDKENTEQQLNKELTQIEQIAAKEKQREKEESGTITELKISLAKQMQDLEHLQESSERLEKERDSLQSEQRVLAQQTIDLVHRLEANEREQEDHKHQIHALRAEKENIVSRLDNLRQQRSEHQDELDEIDAVNRNYRQKLQQIEAAVHKREVDVNRLDVELDNMLTALSEQYEIGYELAKERYEVPEDPDKAKIKVKKLKERIAALGEVNLGAIEESQRVNERLQFLQKQQQDLLDAKATLYEVIREMNVEMSQRFQTTFNQVREQFQAVFVELFGGGRADLQLTDPDSLLDTGIDIVAQPPGKKFQNLSLLSGGERTLTAIVLLFAILRVRPVPFCILDEVEASLDEANVVRFARYLRQFSQHTQFIVITHRKGTMEEADVLYGVTMQESGVSNLVSVKLDEDAIHEVAAASE